MWVFTNKGFISVVKDIKSEGCLLVRARAKGHIKALFPDAKPVRTDHADYRFRISLPREEVACILAAEMAGIDYPNFKDSIPKDDAAGRKYHDACMDVWIAMEERYRNE